LGTCERCRSREDPRLQEWFCGTHLGNCWFMQGAGAPLLDKAPNLGAAPPSAGAMPGAGPARSCASTSRSLQPLNPCVLSPRYPRPVPRSHCPKMPVEQAGVTIFRILAPSVEVARYAVVMTSSNRSQSGVFLKPSAQPVSAAVEVAPVTCPPSGGLYLGQLSFA
jgi:hypothetical protein